MKLADVLHRLVDLAEDDKVQNKAEMHEAVDAHLSETPPLEEFTK